MRSLVRDDERGFTTAGAAVALLLVLALLFASAHAFWTAGTSSQIQYVADSAALAADGVVGEYVVLAQTADAALLTLSLTAIIAYAVSAVAAFIPGGEGVAASIAEAAGKIVQARKQLARTAQEGLNAAQECLPALCALRAAQVVEANARVSGIEYAGVALPLPLQFDPIELSGDEELEEALDQIEEEEEDISREAEEAQQAEEEMAAAKHDGWEADCGGSPSMRERAATLAGLSGSANPSFSSEVNWSWSAALSRARSYYQARYDQESGAAYAGSPEEVGKSVARKRFYLYALSVLDECSVEESSSGGELPNFLLLPRNIQEVKATVMYTESVYPVSSSGGERTIHAYAGCPGCRNGSPVGYLPVSAVDSGGVQVCDACKFSAITLGRVPSASTSISNGFEYHYRKLVEAAQRYREAALQHEESSRRLEEEANTVGDLIKQALDSLGGGRIDIKPPGRCGCIAVVRAGAAATPDESGFFQTEGLQTRAAISGATLAPDPDEASDVISALGADLIGGANAGSGVARVLFGIWADLLSAYSSGVDGLEHGLESALGAIPLAGTRMSQRATQLFEEKLEDVGLQPADTSLYKPVLVNTSYILEADGTGVSRALLAVKNAAEAAGVAGANPVALIADALNAALAESDLPEGALVIAQISFDALGLGTGSGALELAVPEGSREQLSAALGAMQQAGQQ